MRGYKVMYDYRGKVSGMVIAALGTIALLIQKYTHFTVLAGLNSDQHFNVLLWVTLFGLFLMMFSYEKHEDERVKQIRAKAVMIVFGIMTGAILAFALTISIIPFIDPGDLQPAAADEGVWLGRLLMFYPAVGIVLYLLIFHVGIYYDKVWDYSDNISVLENIRKNKWHIIIIAIISIIVVRLIFTILL